MPFAQDTWMPQLPRHANLLVLRTMSKLGLAGIRLGYLAAASASGSRSSTRFARRTTSTC